MLLKNKKANFVENIFIVIFGLIIFFALYPAIANVLDIGVSMHGDDSQAGFFILAIPWVILLGVLVWAYRTVVGGSE